MWNIWIHLWYSVSLDDFLFFGSSKLLHLEDRKNIYVIDTDSFSLSETSYPIACTA